MHHPRRDLLRSMLRRVADLMAATACPDRLRRLAGVQERVVRVLEQELRTQRNGGVR